MKEKTYIVNCSVVFKAFIDETLDISEQLKNNEDEFMNCLKFDLINALLHDDWERLYSLGLDAWEEVGRE